MAKGRPVRVNRSRPHKVGNRWLSDYDLGWDLWYTRKVLPLNASRAMQQGYVNAAKGKDKCLIASMRWQARIGLFEFLPSYQHLAAGTGNSLSVGAESRYDLRVARAQVKFIKSVTPV